MVVVVVIMVMVMVLVMVWMSAPVYRSDCVGGRYVVFASEEVG